MHTIARNAIYAATIAILWPHTLYANHGTASLSPVCPPFYSPQLNSPQLSYVANATHATPALTTSQAQSTSGVHFDMRPGRLRPQLERVLRQHMGVQHVLWQASDEHDWPTSYALHAASWPALVESLLSPYRLRLQLFANHSAVITYQQPMGGEHGG